MIINLKKATNKFKNLKNNSNKANKIISSSKSKYPNSKTSTKNFNKITTL